MIRLRMNGLMSRASTLVLAAIGSAGATGTASAAPCFPLPSGQAINEVYISNPTDCVLITGDSVAANATTGNSFTNVLNNVIGAAFTDPVGVDITAGSTLTGTFLNNGTIYGTATGVRISNSALLAGFVNNGWIEGTTGDGVDITNSNIAGGFTNSGRILGTVIGGIGLDVLNTSLTTRHTISGAISNSGTIQGNAFGMFFGGEGAITLANGITNSGRILSGDSSAIFLGDNVNFSGGINNSSSTARIISDRNTGIRVEADSFAGGIHNQGTIGGADLGVGGDGIHLAANNPTFTGGITNSGLIFSDIGDGIEVESDVFGTASVVGQGIFNQVTGVIRGSADAIGVYSEVTTFNGGITNAGLIDSTGSTGIEISAENFNGGISNSGTIFAENSGIDINNTNFEGGIDIAATGLIHSAGDGINVGTSAVFSNSVTPAGINNAGHIVSDTGDGIDIEALSFWGGVTNSGTIDTTDNAIEIGTGVAQIFHGGVTNSGLINAGSNGIDINVQDFLGGVTNSSPGLINANTIGINIIADTFAGGVHNSGSILGSSGVVINVVNSFDGGVHNSGWIHATSGDGISIDPITFTGGITNTGTIIAEGGEGTFDGIDVSAGTFSGGIVNSGTILAEGRGIIANVTTFHGGINNSGKIVITDNSGTNIGIRVFASDFDGGLTNSGTILTGTDTGIRLTIANGFAGGITNSGSITSGSDALHVDVAADFAGGITNSGLMDAGDDGIRTEGANFGGGIKNLAGGQIIADESGIQTTNSTFAGGITNAGTILAGVEGINVNNVTNFSGGINNSGSIISATNTAVEVDATTFTGGFVNSGFIEANGDTAVNIDAVTFSNGFSNTSSGTIIGTNDGVRLSGGTFNGGFTNAGLIDADNTGVEISSDLFNGGFTNSGTIIGGSDGVYLSGTTANGGFTNTGTITAFSTGVSIAVTTFNGNFTNSGAITGNTFAGVDIDVTDFNGSVVNSGTIQSVTNTGLYITASNNFVGGVTNSGQILATDDEALYISDTDMTGPNANVVNSGKIYTQSSTALYVTGSDIGGKLTNSGLIQSLSSDAILITGGNFAGGITNSGTILAGDGDDALDLSGADAAHVVTQTAGVMQGNIDLTNGYNDVLNLNGGSLDGDIGGELGDDTVNVGAGSAPVQGAETEGDPSDDVDAGTFAYLRGSMDGVENFNVNSGTAILGARFVGTNGQGVTTGVNGIETMRVNAGGTVYLDDTSRINVNNSYTQNAAGEVQFLLSRDLSDNAFAGQIDVNGNANIDGTITGVIDLPAFALGAGTTNSFFYDNVIDSTNLNGTFDNVGVLNNLIFFDLQAEYDGFDNVDLRLTRLGFADVLAPASQSSNQAGVGGVLETIYNNGGFDPAFAAAFEKLLGSSSYAEALAVYDQLLGAEHAQASLGSLNAMHQFQGLLGERMDVLHNGMGSAKWAMSGSQVQTAMAETVLADASPTPGLGGDNLVTTRDGNTISMWGGVHGNWTSVDGDTNGPGFDQDTFGISGGVDYALSSESLIGLGGSYMNSDLSFDSSNSGDVDTFAVGGYGTFGLGGGYLDANANVAFHNVSTSRETPAPDIASADYNGTSWSVSGELGTVVPVGHAYVSPMLSLTYTGLSVDGFTETGSAFALVVDQSDTDSISTVLGARAGDYFKVGKAVVNLQGNLGWRHEFGDNNASFTGAFVVDPSLLFNVESSKIADDSATFGVGTTVTLSTRLDVFLNYDGVWNAEANSHNAAVGVRANW